MKISEYVIKNSISNLNSWYLNANKKSSIGSVGLRHLSLILLTLYYINQNHPHIEHMFSLQVSQEKQVPRKLVIYVASSFWWSYLNYEKNYGLDNWNTRWTKTKSYLQIKV